MMGAFPDGVWLVELAPLSDPGLLIQSVAQVVGVKEQANKAFLQCLCEYWRKKRVLLVLDNCEHMLSPSSQLAETLVRQCSNLSVISSSREAMGVGGEQSYRVPSLSVPPLPL